jgi:flavin-dependent dehydrogenase
MNRRRYPVKHGVRVYGPTGNAFWVPVMGRDPETGLFDATTWQVPRAEFDALMLDAALERGAVLMEGEAVAPLREGDDVSGVRVRTAAGEEEVHARVVVDASGASAFLSRTGVIGRKERGLYDNQLAVFSQVTGAVRDPGPDGGNTLIFYNKPGQWSWFIPLDDDVVSVGVVVPAEHFKAQRLSKADFLRQEIVRLNPSLTTRLRDIQFVEEARAVSNYSYEISHYTGARHLCVGDSHRFIDPVFSFGLHFAVKEGQFAAEAIERHLGAAVPESESDAPFLDYQRLSTRGMDAIQSLIDAFWERPTQFALIAHRKHREETIDLFAGRVYGERPSRALTAMREIVNKARGLPVAAR